MRFGRSGLSETKPMKPFDLQNLKIQSDGTGSIVEQRINMEKKLVNHI
jgi:hypothetical protein